MANDATLVNAGETATWSHDRLHHRFDLARYHRMIETGVLTDEDRVEFLDGWIVDMTPIGAAHGTAVTLVHERLAAVTPAGWHVRSQHPVSLANSEPQADVVVLRGDVRRFAAQHPTAADVVVIIEVADSSLERDRREKARLYSAAGIPVYWIVNLVDRRVEVLSQPTPGNSARDAHYAKAEYFVAGQAAPFSVPGETPGAVRVADILP